MRLRDTGLTGSVARGDDARYLAASADGHAVTVLDIGTHVRRTVPAPAAGCAFTDLHHGKLLWSCDNPDTLFDSGVTEDLATGQIGALAQLHATPGTFPDTASYVRIGEHWVQAGYVGYHISYATYVDRATGQPQAISPRRDAAIDLDAPSLTRKLCNGQRRPYVSGADGISLQLADLAIAGRWAAGTTYDPSNADGPAAVELQHCDSKPRRLKVCRKTSCGEPVITGRFVAWVESTADTARLVVRSLRTGRTRTTTWRARPLTPLLVADHLYVQTGAAVLSVAL